MSLFSYRDMRREAGFEIRSMWYNLGELHGLVTSALVLFLSPESDLMISM